MLSEKESVIIHEREQKWSSRATVKKETVRQTQKAILVKGEIVRQTQKRETSPPLSQSVSFWSFVEFLLSFIHELPETHTPPYP